MKLPVFRTPVALLPALFLGTAFGSAGAQAQPAAAPFLPANMTQCATEGQRCTFTGQRNVAFGAGGKYVMVQKEGGVDCTTAAFGADPAVNTPKLCYVMGNAAQAPAQPLNSRERLQSAVYFMNPPVVQGNTSIIGEGQLKSVTEAMTRDAAGAIQRRYPNAVITTDPHTFGSIKVTPVLVAPTSLTPWASLQAQLLLQDSATGQKLVSQSKFGLLDVYNHRADAANYVFDQLASRLP